MSDLDEKVTRLGEKYLGFAAEKYLQRQCSIHLEKDLSDLEADDLEDLAKWIEKTGPLIADDDTVQQLKDDILALQNH